MALTDAFIDAVSNNDTVLTKIMLKDIMLIDPSFKSFDEMIAYAEKNMPELYDEHDSEEFSDSYDSWTEDYMNEQLTALVGNFSKERIRFLKSIIQYLYKDQIKEKASSASHSTKEGTEVQTTNNRQAAGGVLTAVGAGVLIGGIVGSNIAVAVVGGIAAAGGVAILLNGDK